MTNGEILDFMRQRFDRVDEQLHEIGADILDLKLRVTSLEIGMSKLHGDIARQSTRIDRRDVSDTAAFSLRALDRKSQFARLSATAAEA
jgi:hypothetical protein